MGQNMAGLQRTDHSRMKSNQSFGENTHHHHIVSMINLIYNKQVEGGCKADYLRVFRRIQHEWQNCKPAGMQQESPRDAARPGRTSRSPDPVRPFRRQGNRPRERKGVPKSPTRIRGDVCLYPRSPESGGTFFFL